MTEYEKMEAGVREHVAGLTAAVSGSPVFQKLSAGHDPSNVEHVLTQLLLTLVVNERVMPASNAQFEKDGVGPSMAYPPQIYATALFTTIEQVVALFGLEDNRKNVTSDMLQLFARRLNEIMPASLEMSVSIEGGEPLALDDSEPTIQ